MFDSQKVGTSYHHDGRDYDVAKSEAARWFTQKHEKQIEAGRAKAAAVIERVYAGVPQDSIVRADKMKFVANGNLVLQSGDSKWGIHKHALNQVCSRADIPSHFAKKMLKPDKGEKTVPQWRRDLLAYNLNEIYGHNVDDAKYLVRAIGGEVRGFLSDSYRRLDSRPLVEAFVSAIQEFHAVPLDGTVSDTRVALKAVLPWVFEPIPGEVLTLGLHWQNSDFGAGKHCIRFVMNRVGCTNKAISEDLLGQVHLGSKLSEDFQFSQETYAKDLAASVSALRDIVRGHLKPEKISGVMDAIRRANEREVTWGQFAEKFKGILSKAEVMKAEDAFNGDDVEMLPAGKSAWRMSNALSWVANGISDPDKKLEVERAAGRVIDMEMAPLVKAAA